MYYAIELQLSFWQCSCVLGIKCQLCVDIENVYRTLWEVAFDSENIYVQHAVSECCQTV